MNNNVGLRSLIPVTTDDDIREQLEARAAVEKMVGAVTPALEAARSEQLKADSYTPLVNFTLDFYQTKTPLTKKEIEDKKFKKMMEDEYGEKALEKDVRAKIYKNKKAGKGEYEDFARHNIIIAENMRDRARKQIKAQAKQTDDLMLKAIRNSSTPVPGYVGGATPQSLKVFS